MKRALLMAAVGALLLAPSSGAEILEQIVAKVGSRILTLSEFQALQLAVIQRSGVTTPAEAAAFLRQNNARHRPDTQKTSASKRPRNPAWWSPCGRQNHIVAPLKTYKSLKTLVPQGRIELPTSPLPRVRSTTELQQRKMPAVLT